MNIPWSMAPKWAKWLAIDANGTPYWFQFRPIPAYDIDNVGFWGTGKRIGYFEFANIPLYCDPDAWKSLIWERPRDNRKECEV